jgi:Putative Tad-like Flp pilus-assembly
MTRMKRRPNAPSEAMSRPQAAVSARRRRSGEAGQALVLMVMGIAMVVVVATALVVDGGNAWSQQRIVQNGSDASAEAGAIVMAEKFAGSSAPAGGWDSAVNSQVQTIAAANGLTLAGTYYTDICGIPLKPDGTAALNPNGTYDLSAAARVGQNEFPGGSATTPDCPALVVGPPAGVLVVGQKQVATYLAGVIGMKTITIDAQATAVSGYLQGFCDASQGEACAVLPVTVPVDVVTCSGNNGVVDTGSPWILNQLYKVPLCNNDPGNVGWLDWTPPSGGSSELIQSILHPNNPAINLPSWQYVTETGGPNDAGIQDAIRTYDGQVVMIPQFDLTCNPGPNQSPDAGNVSNSAAHYGCLNASTNDLGGNGQNQWYRMPSFAFFQLCSSADPDCAAANAPYGAYTNGNNKSVCDTGNGATQCLVGKFVSILNTGTVGPGVGGGSGQTKVIGVQLIK